jgi:hypothetical protein
MGCENKACGTWSRRVVVSWDGAYTLDEGGKSHPFNTKKAGDGGPAACASAVEADFAAYKAATEAGFKDGGTIECVKTKDCNCICAHRKDAKPEILVFTERRARSIKSPLQAPGTLAYTVELAYEYEEPTGKCKEGVARDV